MVKIKINGKELEGRNFQNMPQALAFAFQNGNCHIAQTLELISSEEKEKPEPELTGTVSIVGTLKEGEVLTADISGLEGLKETDQITYQWYREGKDISTGEMFTLAIEGAVEKTFTLTADDADSRIGIRVDVEGYENGFLTFMTDGIVEPSVATAKTLEEMTFEELTEKTLEKEITYDALTGTEEEMKDQLLAIIREAEIDLEEMTEDQLIAFASANDIEVDPALSKEELLAAIEAALEVNAQGEE